MTDPKSPSYVCVFPVCHSRKSVLASPRAATREEEQHSVIMDVTFPTSCVGFLFGSVRSCSATSTSRSWVCSAKQHSCCHFFKVHWATLVPAAHFHHWMQQAPNVFCFGLVLVLQYWRLNPGPCTFWASVLSLSYIPNAKDSYFLFLLNFVLMGIRKFLLSAA